MSTARGATRPLRWLAGLALAGVAAAAVGCGGGGGGWYHPAPVGTLVVENSPASSETIEDVDISVAFGPIESHHVLLDPGETYETDLYPDSYDVDVFWSDGRIDHLVLEVHEHSTTGVTLTN